MQYIYGWAKQPMLPRLGKNLDINIPITLILGQRSWMKSVYGRRCLGETISEVRPQSYVDVYNIPGAGHHVHADQPEVFNEVVNRICDVCDNGRDREMNRLNSSDTAERLKE